MWRPRGRTAFIVLALALCSCDEERPPPATDAALPACADLCASALCNADGVCSCVVDGAAVSCRRDP